MSSPILSVRNLKVEFPTRRARLVALDDISFDIMPGEVLGMVGESGAGKSVTGAAIVGLLEPPGRISGGEILLSGTRIDNLRPAAMRRIRGKRIGMVFQDPLTSLDPLYTIGEQLTETIATHSTLSGAALRARAIELLSEVGLPAPERRLDNYPHQFSGGMRQRVVLALALAANPELIIADEPTTALDVSVQAQILNLLLDLRREFKLSYVLVSHNLSVVEHMATQVAVMYLGRIVELDDAERLFRNPRHPYTKVLLRSAMTIAPRAGIPNVRLGGAIPNPAALPSGCRFHPRCPEALPICSRVDPPRDGEGECFAECHLVTAAESTATNVVPNATSAVNPAPTTA